MRWAAVLLAGLLSLACVPGARSSPVQRSPQNDAISPLTIRISGMPGLNFRGNYLVLDADGGSTSRSVQGRIPGDVLTARPNPGMVLGEEYRVVGRGLSASFQSQDENGYLQLDILRGDTILKTSQAFGAYAIVSISL